MTPLARILFFGSGEFAIPSLAALCEAGRRPLRVVSQPPKPAGRGRRTQDPPLARWARGHGLSLLQPVSVRVRAFFDEVAALSPDLGVVVAFGQLFPAELLALPRHGCINLHASLLPRHRGASPVQAALAAGDRTTGVTIQRMVEALDAGPVLLQREVAIGEEETAGELAARLAAVGAALLLEALDGLERGEIEARPQRGEPSHAPRLRRATGRVDWSLPAAELFNRLRALTPWPGLTAELRGQPVKLVRARALDVAGGGAPGTILGLRDGSLAVACGGETVLGIESLQRPGRRPVTATDFLHGERLQAGERFA